MRGFMIDGPTLRRWRRDRGMTQESLARSASCDIKTIRSAEKGGRLDASTVTRIADALGLPLAALVVEENAAKDAERNCQLFHQWQDAHNRRDVEALLHFYHNDAVLLVPGAADLPGGGESSGITAIREHFVRTFEAFLMDKLRPDDYKLDAAGDFVFVRSIPSATVCATGARFTAPAVLEFEIRDGKISRHTIIADTAPMRRCLPDQTPQES